ncbi:MAG: hypothetical protein LBC88_03715, partial [Spirochaetaceae bacterium]|nr:hypothetical protein [Spirochaetaceae bacterium]
LEFWRCKRQNSTLQAQKEPENRDFCGLLAAKIHNLNRLLNMRGGRFFAGPRPKKKPPRTGRLLAVYPKEQARWG